MHLPGGLKFYWPLFCAVGATKCHGTPWALTTSIMFMRHRLINVSYRTFPSLTGWQMTAQRLPSAMLSLHRAHSLVRCCFPCNRQASLTMSVYQSLWATRSVGNLVLWSHISIAVEHVPRTRDETREARVGCAPMPHSACVSQTVKPPWWQQQQLQHL